MGDHILLLIPNGMFGTNVRRLGWIMSDFGYKTISTKKI